jgi:membrane protein involved in colicin uptake
MLVTSRLKGLSLRFCTNKHDSVFPTILCSLAIYVILYNLILWSSYIKFTDLEGEQRLVSFIAVKGSLQ